MSDDVAPIIIRKVVKKAGHHGGSWKVAFADFATAMMAFFLLLWLLGATDARQKGAISEFFNNPSRIPGTTDIPTPNPVNGPGGAGTSLIEFHAIATTNEPEHTDLDIIDNIDDRTSFDSYMIKTTPDPDIAEELAAAQEALRMEELRDRLQTALTHNPAFHEFKDQLLIDIVNDGLRIQIIDKKNRPMFDLGSETLKSYTRQILEKIAQTINSVPNRISISGHTDAHAYSSRRNYTNWELSSDRANAARRALVNGGLVSDKIAEVVGRGSSVPLQPEDVFAPVNRRISIIVMNSRADGKLRQKDQNINTPEPEPIQSVQAEPKNFIAWENNPDKQK